MEGYVYILKSEKSGRFYIGSTNNVDRRLCEHNSGHTRSLLNQRPVTIVFSQKYENIVDARSMELRLKKLKSRKILEKIIADRHINIGPVA